MSVLVEFAMFPTDKSESVSKYVSRIIKMFKNSEIKYELTPMGTVFEIDTMENALKMLQSAYETLKPDCNRIYSTVKFDIRKNKNNRMSQKIKSVEDKIGKVSL